MEIKVDLDKALSEAEVVLNGDVHKADMGLRTAYRDMCMAIHQYGGSGSISLKINMKATMDVDGQRQIEFSTDIGVKAPTRKARKKQYYVNRKGETVKNSPNQTELPYEGNISVISGGE